MMQTQLRQKRTLRAIGAGRLVAVSIGLSGCYQHIEDGGYPEQFCGYLYACGNHGGSDDNEPRSSNSSSNSSSSSSSSSNPNSESPETTEGE